MGYAGKISVDNGPLEPIGSTLFGVCETPATTALKLIRATAYLGSNFTTLIDGVTVHIQFKYGNTVTNGLQLKIGDTDAKPISNPGGTLSWPQGAVLSFTYDGTQWVVNDGLVPAGGIVENTYDPTSSNAISGRGVAEAIASVSPGGGGSGGYSIDTEISGTPSNINVPTSAAVANYVAEAFGIEDAIVYKGTISNNNLLPVHGYSAGWLYRVLNDGIYAGQRCMEGDFIVAIADADPSSYSLVPSHWAAIQTHMYDITSNSSIENNDALVVADANNNFKLIRTDLLFHNNSNNYFLSQAGTWELVGDYIPYATSENIGGIKIGYITNEDNYAVQLQNGQAYVHVPLPPEASMVQQIGVNDNKDYPILFKFIDDTTDETSYVKYTKGTGHLVTINPNMGQITAPGGLVGSATSAEHFLEPTQVILQGTVTGQSNLSTFGWTVNTSIGNSEITNSMLAGDIANNKLLYPYFTIGQNEITLGSTLTIAQFLAILGLTTTMRFMGVATVPIRDGSNTDPEIPGYTEFIDGDVILDREFSREFVWSTANGGWEMLGGDDPYKIIQTPLLAPTPETNKWVSAIGQSANGNIEVAYSVLDTTGTWLGNAATASYASTADNVTNAYLITTPNAIAYYADNAGTFANGQYVTYLNHTAANAGINNVGSLDGLVIEGVTYNNAADLISNISGQLTFGDAGPQLQFSDSSECGAIIYSRHNNVSGMSGTFNFVNDTSDVAIKSEGLVARIRAAIGQNNVDDNYTLKVNGNALIASTDASQSVSTGALVVNGGIATNNASFLTGSVHIIGDYTDNPLIVHSISGGSSSGIRGNSASLEDQGLLLNVTGGPIIMGYAVNGQSNNVSIDYLQDANSLSSGALHVGGGASVAKTLYVGTGANITGQVIIDYIISSSIIKGSSQLQVCNSSGNDVAIELRSGALDNTANGAASWQIGLENGVLSFNSDYPTTGLQLTNYGHSILQLEPDTANAIFGGNIQVGTFTIGDNDSTTYAAQTISSTAGIIINRATNTSIVFEDNDVAVVCLDENNAFRPEVDDTLEIGTIDYRWQSGYFTTQIFVGPTTYSAAISNENGVYIAPSNIILSTTTTDNGLHIYGATQEYICLSIETLGAYSTGGKAALTLGNSISTGTTANARGLVRLYHTNEHYSEYYSDGWRSDGAISSFTMLGATSESLNIHGWTTLILGNGYSYASLSPHSEGEIVLYSEGTTATTIRSQAGHDEIFYLPHYNGDMYAVHGGSNDPIGSETQPVYVDEDGRVTPFTTTVGDPYTPIYINAGITTTVSPIQYAAFRITNGKYGVQLVDDAFTPDTYVLQIVVTTGINNLNAPLDWNSETEGKISIITGSPVSGTVEGYIIVARGCTLTPSRINIISASGTTEGGGGSGGNDDPGTGGGDDPGTGGEDPGTGGGEDPGTGGEDPGTGGGENPGGNEEPPGE